MVYEVYVLCDFYEGLVVYSVKGEIILGVVESWMMLDDGMVYMFMLCDDVKWLNGDFVVVGDFVYLFCWIMILEIGVKYVNIFYLIKNVEVVNKGDMLVEDFVVKVIDDWIFEIVLEVLMLYFIDFLGYQIGLLVYLVMVEVYGIDFVKLENMVFNGLFIFVEFMLNVQLKVVKNLNFYDVDNVQIDIVIFYLIEDRGVVFCWFQVGELYINNDVLIEQVIFMKEELGDQFCVVLYFGNYYYVVNYENEVLSNLEVCQVLFMVIDWEFLVDEIWGGVMVVGYFFVLFGIGNYGELVYVDYKDMFLIDWEDKVIVLLEVVGFFESNLLKLEICYNMLENYKNMVVVIVDMWKLLGVEVIMFNIDVVIYYVYLWDCGDFDVVCVGWIGDYFDLQNFFFMVESDNIGFNYVWYNNVEYDVLMDEVVKIVDLEKCVDILKQVEGMFMCDLLFILLMYYGFMNLVFDKVSGFEDNFQNIYLIWWMSIFE